MTSINHHRFSASLKEETPLSQLEDAIDGVSDIAIGSHLSEPNWLRLQQLAIRLGNLARNAEAA